MYYYIQKGHKLEELLRLGSLEKYFYYACMVKAIEEREELLARLTGKAGG